MIPRGTDSDRRADRRLTGCWWVLIARHGVLDSFTDDGVVDDWGREFRGREAIAGWNHNEKLGVHSHFAIHRVTQDGSAFAATGTVKGDGYHGGGTFTFEVAGDLVSRFTIR